MYICIYLICYLSNKLKGSNRLIITTFLGNILTQLELNKCVDQFWRLLEFVRKIFFIIDHHLARHFLYYVECLSSPLPILCSQIITPFLIQ